ncbi:unnamed protein product, partial [Owenia fusiformis]
EDAVNDKGSDILEPEETKPCKFANCYSDTEDEDEDDDSEDDEEDFSKGINTFLECVRERRQIRDNHVGPFTSKHVGIENRVVAAATFEKAFCGKRSEKVNHLTVIAVRKRYQKWGIGRYLLSQLKNPQVVGQYDVIVVHADNSAIDFFERYGFTDDVVLNSKWSELADQYTNCTLMCYMPPFTGQSILGKSDPALDIVAMEKELASWRNKNLEAYQAQASCLQRMRHEIIHLRALVSSQQDLLTHLEAENEELSRDKYQIEKSFLEFKIMATEFKQKEGSMAEFEDEDEIPTDSLIKDLQRHVDMMKLNNVSPAGAPNPDQILHAIDDHQYMLSKHEPVPYDHGKDMEEFFKMTQEFQDKMKLDTTMTATYESNMVNKAMLHHS